MNTTYYKKLLKIKKMVDDMLISYYQEYRKNINNRANIARRLRLETRNKHGKVIDIPLDPLVSFLQTVDNTMEKMNNEQKIKELRKQARDKQVRYSKIQRQQNSIKNRNRYLQQRYRKNNNKIRV